MEKILIDFVRELLDADGIPHHCLTLPCQDWDWLDLGLRSGILGMTDLHRRMNRFFEDLKENTLYHYMDSFQCSYSIFSLPAAGHAGPGEEVAPCRKYLIIGPVLFEPLHGERFEALFETFHLPPQLMEPLYSYYQNVTLLPSPSHHEGMMAVLARFLFKGESYDMVFRSDGDPENLRHHYEGIARIPEQPSLSIQYIEERYKAENALLSAIGHGNEAHAMESVKRLIDLGIPPRLADTLRDRKDLSITLNSLLRKAAEQAGVHPIHIDSFSNQNIRQIEQLASLEECKGFQHRLALGYCRLVKRYSLKGCSLPVQKAVTYITTDLSADLGLKALAGQLNMTPSYLSSLFKKEMGVTLTDYVNQQRIAHAQHLLLDTSLPIKSIAQQCGIADLNYFMRLFKRMAGVTPKAFRDATDHSRQMEFRQSNAKRNQA